ncbi:proteinase [Pseudomonas fluorescens]|nr:proteinase [Pseudomonas fluorescens]
MTLAKHLACSGLWLAASLGYAEPLIKPTAIDWQLDCSLPGVERLDPSVLERTQCGLVSVPRNYAAPGQGNLRLRVTRVGARQPLSREGLIFVQAGEAPSNKTAGTFAVHLASRWGNYATQAYRTLLNRYDIIELDPRNLNQANAVEQAAQDMEFVRAQLGDAQLHYLGNAEATRLGSRYAELFSERVARMVLVNAAPFAPSAAQVQQVHLKGANNCVMQWIGDFLAYGKQPPPSTRCLDSSGGNDTLR